MNPELESFAALIFRSSVLLTAVLAVLLMLRQLEPQWRILLARAAIVALPVMVGASLLAPLAALPWYSPAALSDEANRQLVPAVELMAVPEVIVNGGVRAGVEVESGGLPGVVFWVLLLWGVISLLLVVPHLGRLRCIVREAHDGEMASPELRRRWREICTEFGIDGAVSIRTVTKNCSPYLVGGSHPLLVVPAGWLQQAAPGDVDHVLRHEAAHLRSGDLWWLPAARLLACVLWFQPLMWVLQVLHLRACEEAADAAAARRGGAESYRQALARLALELVPASSVAPAAFLRMPSVVARLRVVGRHVKLRPPTRWRGVFAAGAVMVIGFAMGNVGLAEKQADSTKQSTEGALALKIDSIAYEDTSLKEALRLLQVAADGLTAANSQGKGAAFPYRLKLSDDVDGDVQVTLKLQNVPVGEALKYLTQLAGVSYRVEGRNIHVEKVGGTDREKFIQAVKEGWEAPAGEGIEAVTQMLKSQVIPKLDFDDTPLKDALATLEQFSHEAAAGEQGGVRIMLDDAVSGDIKITLRLTNVPLAEALRYVGSLANAVYRVGEKGVKVVPLGTGVKDLLYTTVYKVPPGGLFVRVPGTQVDAKAILEAVGITFPPGAAAVYNAKTDQLIVRNTKAQMDLVEVWIESLREQADLAKPSDDIPNSASAVDPSDVWFRAYLMMKDGKDAEEAGRIVEARAKYESSLAAFRKLGSMNPDYHPEIVSPRMKMLADKIDALSKQTGGSAFPAVSSAAVKIDEMRDNLAESVLRIGGATSRQHQGESKGQRHTLSIEVVSESANDVDASGMNLRVYFYDIIGDDRLEASTADSKTGFPSAPYDWKGKPGVETVEVEYFLPGKSATKDGRNYYGYVAELYYEGVLQDVTAEPSKLMRIAP